jgi:hypothetical protein
MESNGKLAKKKLKSRETLPLSKKHPFREIRRANIIWGNTYWKFKSMKKSMHRQNSNSSEAFRLTAMS